MQAFAQDATVSLYDQDTIAVQIYDVEGEPTVAFLDMDEEWVEALSSVNTISPTVEIRELTIHIMVDEETRVRIQTREGWSDWFHEDTTFTICPPLPGDHDVFPIQVNSETRARSGYIKIKKIDSGG
ncbi:MAG: hypothetical protein AAFV53_33205 [Myxococcota bacterium]